MPPSDLNFLTPCMQMYDDGYKNITNVDVRCLWYSLLCGLIVSHPVLFCGHRPNATTPQHDAAGNGMLVGSGVIHTPEAYSFSGGVVADVRELPFDAGAFDVALDKGECPSHDYAYVCHSFPGTMDAMMTTKGDVWVIGADVV